ncbi:uncharacterized protein [Coffea arabica]|uniref:Uncharacterized protein n=1 Tax=Coffea arabica TaxID=13443 RepID=A0ABM4VLU3_COFAR
MVELQSRASLVNASALRAIDSEVKGDSSVNLVAEISAELQREKQKNAELMQRITILEAQTRERDNGPLVFCGQDYCRKTQNTVEHMSKRQKVETNSMKPEGEDIRVGSYMKHNSQCMPDKDVSMKEGIVTWMGMDETEFLQSEFLKGSDSAAEFEDTDDTGDEDGEADVINSFGTDPKSKENSKELTCAKEVKEILLKQEVNGEGDTQNVASSSSSQGKLMSAARVDKQVHEYVIEKRLKSCMNPIASSRECDHQYTKETIMTGGHGYTSYSCTPRGEIKICDNMFLQKKPPKIAFCPKEVKRMIQSKQLLVKNAQSHTVRKIIVFASLGTRHGCEDMYELDFNHFSILRKGEPYLSPKDPGEHVLYENPGVRRKIFYPNRQNPTLCPVQILQEEKAMRPQDASCPSCLFLCIKYGGRTRNIPQNEYVRQRMGRNKLKSFGPAICRMSMLVHIRGGSFFFKALGITLLFMAGYPDDLVQRETKYRNLDLLQKYYRTDEDAEGEELFLPDPVNTDTNDSLPSSLLSMKTISRKLKCKKNSYSACHGTKEKTSILPSAPSTCGASSQFELKGYASLQNQAITAAQSITSQSPADLFSNANPLIGNANSNIIQCDQSSCPMFPPHPTSSFVPMMYWHPSTAFLHYPHPSSHIFRHPIAGNYISIYPQPYYGPPTLIPKPSKDTWKSDVASENANYDSNSTSCSIEPKKIRKSDK